MSFAFAPGLKCQEPLLSDAVLGLIDQSWFVKTIHLQGQ